MNESEALWAAEKKKMGYTFLQIAEVFHLTPQTIVKHLRARNISWSREPLRCPQNCKNRKDFAWEALLDGYTLDEIAAAMGLSTYSVKTLLEGKRKLMPPLTTVWIPKDEENEYDIEVEA